MNKLIENWMQDIANTENKLRDEMLYLSLYEKELFFNDFFDNNCNIEIDFSNIGNGTCIINNFTGYVNGNKKYIYNAEFKAHKLNPTVMTDNNFTTGSKVTIENNKEGINLFYSCFLTKKELTKFNYFILEKIIPSKNQEDAKKLKI